MKKTSLLFFISIITLFLLLIVSCASIRLVTSAEEYYTLGMAYFELGKYEEAEQWLNRARMVDKTKTATDYNLGRIAFERGRYKEALRHFNDVLVKDPENVTALKAASYTQIKLGDIVKAEDLYERVLQIIPESFDNGYNYALVLYAMEKYDKAEEVLNKYELVLDTHNEAILLLARTQAKQDKIEAADTYNTWLQTNTDNNVRYEYAQVLEKGEFFARALEEYRMVSSSLSQGSVQEGELSQNMLQFKIAQVLLIADGENEEGIGTLKEAVEKGFNDFTALESLLDERRISEGNKEEIRIIIQDAKAKAENTEEQNLLKENDEVQ
ncbi:MAG: tetratricopeptide repeat protein [Treponema sp.]|jgi:tetratricopeptide (TPR) repeat protein|nr:tetratricopeptide repeat protein [Treponema sp.]